MRTQQKRRKAAPSSQKTRKEAALKGSFTAIALLYPNTREKTMASPLSARQSAAPRLLPSLGCNEGSPDPPLEWEQQWPMGSWDFHPCLMVPLPPMVSVDTTLGAYTSTPIKFSHLHGINGAHSNEVPPHACMSKAWCDSRYYFNKLCRILHHRLSSKYL